MFNKESNPWQLVTFLLIGLIVGYGLSEWSGTETSTDTDTGTQTITITPQSDDEDEAEIVEVDLDDDPGLGDPDATVKIVEFSDFQCFYCRRFYNQTLSQLKENYIDKGLVYFVYRDFPLSDIHPDAQKASEASECADEQGKFWEMHDMIYDGQNELGSGTVDIPLESLKSYAVELGLDADTFNECLDSGKYEDEVAADQKAGLSYGASATPSFFINGQIVVGAQSYETLAEIIDSQL
jgi:protein-disulfide isomerase